MNGNYKLDELKTMSSQLFDWEHSSRNTNETMVKRIEERIRTQEDIKTVIAGMKKIVDKR